MARQGDIESLNKLYLRKLYYTTNKHYFPMQKV